MKGEDVRQDDFFETADDGQFSYKRLNHDFIDGIRRGLPVGVSDDDVAYALIYLLIEDLPMDPEHEGLLDNSETGAVIRCLKAVLWRMGVEYELPFHDKRGYYSFRADNNNGLNTDLSRVFAPAREALERRERVHFGGGLRGLRGDLRNLIFAAKQKPEIVWRDVAAGTIEITRNKQHCLLYDRPVGVSGLTWGQLEEWWRLQDGNYGLLGEALRKALRDRLMGGSMNEPEQLMLASYWRFSVRKGFDDIPALLPQVFLHYDPLTQEQRMQRAEGQVLVRQRMDFLLLAPGGGRYVLELDGKQHYSRNGQAAPDLYAEMVKEDRRLRLQGYEVFRFGGAEFVNSQAAEAMLSEFFAELLRV